MVKAAALTAFLTSDHKLQERSAYREHFLLHKLLLVPLIQLLRAGPRETPGRTTHPCKSSRLFRIPGTHLSQPEMK